MNDARPRPPLPHTERAAVNLGSLRTTPLITGSRWSMNLIIDAQPPVSSDFCERALWSDLGRVRQIGKAPTVVAAFSESIERPEPALR